MIIYTSIINDYDLNPSKNIININESNFLDFYSEQDFKRFLDLSPRSKNRFVKYNVPKCFSGSALYLDGSISLKDSFIKKLNIINIKENQIYHFKHPERVYVIEEAYQNFFLKKNNEIELKNILKYMKKENTSGNALIQNGLFFYRICNDSINALKYIYDLYLEYGRDQYFTLEAYNKFNIEICFFDNIQNMGSYYTKRLHLK